MGEPALYSLRAISGAAPISYAWAVTDPGGATDNARLDSTTNSTVTFTSGATQGIYRVQCTVTNAAGSLFTHSVQLTVSDEFSLDVSAEVTHVAYLVYLRTAPHGAVGCLRHSGARGCRYPPRPGLRQRLCTTPTGEKRDGFRESLRGPMQSSRYKSS